MREMTELLVLDLVEKHLMTDQVVLTVGYDIENLTVAERSTAYQGEITTDRYGRKVPKQANGTETLPGYTSSTEQIMEAVMKLFDRIVNPSLLVRRMYVVTCRLITEEAAKEKESFVQMDLFSDFALGDTKTEEQKEHEEKERKLQEAMISVKKKYGKNAILKGMNLSEGATTIERNGQIGGHKA